MAHLDRDGVRIHYHLSGAGDNHTRSGNNDSSNNDSGNGALPLLLTHGYGASSQMWEPNVAALAAGRPVITWDLRGHGRSDYPDDQAQYTQSASIADMAAVLDACGAQRAVIGGLSLGGYLSLAFWLACPERVAGLVLCDTGPGYRNDQARQRWNDRAGRTAERLERDGLAALGTGPHTADHRSARGLALAARGILAQHDGSVIDALPAIDVPVLVLVGADDQPFLGAADYVAAKIPGARKVVIPEAGHLCNLDQPDQFNQHVLAFLGQIGPADQADPADPADPADQAR